MRPISSQEAPARGSFMVPVWDGKPHSDPWTRPYMAPPKPERIAQISFPLVDFRQEVFPHGATNSGNAEGSAFLTSHGFTAVKHQSSLKTFGEFNSPQLMEETYYEEVRELVKRVTGCKAVFISNSTCRGNTAPVDLDSTEAFAGAKDVHKAAIKMYEPFHKPEPTQPVRLPHCDGTALGARRAVRSWMKGITACATEAGIFDHEQKICDRGDLSATSADSRDAFELQYNDHSAGKLGPRYAAYSIWRPIKPVTRDPLAMTPWSEVEASRDFVAEPYDNRNQGFDGDWTRELAMLKVRPGTKAETKLQSEELRFYYISDMQPDEVLFVTMSDTAGLGSGAKAEVGCIHGSPGLGDTAYGDVRESVEVRCMAFW